MGSILNKSYPLSLFSWGKALLFGAFIVLFLFVFQPFGLQGIHTESRIFIVFGYGLLTFLIMLLNQYLLPILSPSMFKETHWTVLSQIVWLLWNVVLIAIFNYYYSIYIFSLPDSLYLFLRFLFYTVFTSVIPIVIFTIVSHNQKLKQNLIKASELNKALNHHLSNSNHSSDDELLIMASNGKDKIKTSNEELLYIESIGNYATVKWVKNQEVFEKKIRNTLKDIEKQLHNQTHIFKTHKAFIVNLNQVQEVSGNAQGYKLTLKTGASQVPVSRTYLKAFNDKMKAV